jgi:hypothetical protein
MDDLINLGGIRNAIPSPARKNGVVAAAYAKNGGNRIFAASENSGPGSAAASIKCARNHMVKETSGLADFDARDLGFGNILVGLATVDRQMVRVNL